MQEWMNLIRVTQKKILWFFLYLLIIFLTLSIFFLPVIYMWGYVLYNEKELGNTFLSLYFIWYYLILLKLKGISENPWETF